jgi:two-component system KDP operon response regulator KdpE
MQLESVPIVLLSNRDDVVSKVQAFELGVDDYVTKPFGMGELLARIRAGLRHQLQAQGERPVFRVKTLSLDLVRRVEQVRQMEVNLSPTTVRFIARIYQTSRQGADAGISVRRTLERPRRCSIPSSVRASTKTED